MQAKVLTPPMFIAQEPQIPSRQERLKVRVGSISFLILIKASKTMGPQAFKSTSYSCILGLSPGLSGFQRYTANFLVLAALKPVTFAEGSAAEAWAAAPRTLFFKRKVVRPFLIWLKSRYLPHYSWGQQRPSRPACCLFGLRPTSSRIVLILTKKVELSKSNFVKVVKFSCFVRNCLYINMAFVIVAGKFKFLLELMSILLRFARFAFKNHVNLNSSEISTQNS